LTLDYLLNDLNSLFDKASLLRSLSISQLSILFYYLDAKFDPLKLNDLKIKILDSLATFENIEDIEQTLISRINFDQVSTQTIIDIIKSNSVFPGNNIILSPKSSRHSASVSVLSQSLTFKHHFKN
jgi:hypothetical protein